MDELKSISGIDTAVNAMIADVNRRKEAMTAEAAEVAAIVTTADNLKERKADRARLNKTRTAIDGERKEIIKRWKSAMLPVENAYKDFVKVFDESINTIDSDLEAFEAARIEEKKAECIKIFEAIEKPEGVADWRSFEDVFNTKWLNATYKPAQIEAEIKDVFNALYISKGTIESLNHAYEKEGLEVLKSTGDLQAAINRMNDLKAVQERREAAEKERALAAERAAAEKDAETARAEEAHEEPDTIEAQAEALPFELSDETINMPFGMPEPTSDPVGYEYKIYVPFEKNKVFKSFLKSVGLEAGECDKVW